MMRRRAASVLFWVSDRLHRLSERIEDMACAVGSAEPSWDSTTADRSIADLWAIRPDYRMELKQFMRHLNEDHPEGDTIHIPRRSMRKDQKPCDQ